MFILFETGSSWVTICLFARLSVLVWTVFTIVQHKHAHFVTICRRTKQNICAEQMKKFSWIKNLTCDQQKQKTTQFVTIHETAQILFKWRKKHDACLAVSRSSSNFQIFIFLLLIVLFIWDEVFSIKQLSGGGDDCCSHLTWITRRMSSRSVVFWL